MMKLTTTTKIRARCHLIWFFPSPLLPVFYIYCLPIHFQCFSFSTKQTRSKKALWKIICALVFIMCSSVVRALIFVSRHDLSCVFVYKKDDVAFRRWMSLWGYFKCHEYTRNRRRYCDGNFSFISRDQFSTQSRTFLSVITGIMKISLTFLRHTHFNYWCNSCMNSNISL